MKKTNRCNQKHQHELQTAEDNWFFSTLSDEAKELMENIKLLDELTLYNSFRQN